MHAMVVPAPSSQDSELSLTHQTVNIPATTKAQKQSKRFVALGELKERAVTSSKALRALARSAPWVVVIPLAVLVLLILAGELSVTYAARQFTQQRHDLARGVVQAAGDQLVFQLQNVLSPNVAVAAAIKKHPHVPSFSQEFPYLAQGILSKVDTTNSVTRVMLNPWGVITAAYPLTPVNMATLNHDYMTDPLRVKSTIDAFAKGPDYTDVIGPLTQLGGTELVLVCRIHVFIANASKDASFGMNETFTLPYAPGLTIGPIKRPETTACGSVCAPKTINGTVYSLWGAVYTLVKTNQFTARLNSLGQQGVPYRYVVLRKVDSSINNADLKTAIFTTAASDTTIFKSSQEPVVGQEDNPECQEVDVPGLGITWVVCIAPVQGWEPSWLMPLQIVVAVTSTVVAGLLFGMLVSQQRHSVLVKLMLPPKVIRYLNLGRTYAEPFKQVTILFSDIVSYTNMSSEMAPSELVELLNSVYSHFDHLVDKHGLYKVETVGDAFMCVGGAPEACSPHDAAVRVARMALDMVDFAKTYAYKDGRNIEIRVGMYTGDVTAAVIGKKMPHWCLVGDAVNVASRMETNSMPMRVHLGHTSAQLLKGHPEFVLQPRGGIQVKGKGTMSTFFLWKPTDSIPDMRESTAGSHSTSGVPQDFISGQFAKAGSNLRGSGPGFPTNDALLTTLDPAFAIGTQSQNANEDNLDQQQSGRVGTL